MDKLHVRGVIVSKVQNDFEGQSQRSYSIKVVISPCYIIGANLEAQICPEVIVQSRVCKGVCLSVKLQNVLGGQRQGCL